MNYRNIIVLVFFLIVNKFSYSQVEETTSLIKWYSFEEAVELQKQQPKTIFIDMYTDWCGWCKKMDKETFQHPGIASYINANFYPVKFDGERKDTVVYNGKTYINEGEGRRPPHQLAVELLKGRMSYPTIVYIDDKFNVNPIGGYMSPEKIEPLLIYFAERVHKSAPFDDFEENFIDLFRDKNEEVDLVNWVSFPKAIELTKIEPKKTVIIIFSEFNRGSNLLIKRSLNDSTLARYLNDNFYSVKLLAESLDTIIVGNQVFANEMKSTNYPHQLPIALLQGKMFYPSILFMDETSRIINKIQGYIPSKGIEPFLYYFAEDKYETVEWPEFQKDFKSSYSK